jgi:hypothetical protein
MLPEFTQYAEFPGKLETDGDKEIGPIAVEVVGAPVRVKDGATVGEKTIAVGDKDEAKVGDIDEVTSTGQASLAVNNHAFWLNATRLESKLL